MEAEAKHSASTPSLLWVLPIACSIWGGLIIEGWFSDTLEERYQRVVNATFEGLLTPGIALLVVWLLMAPVGIGARLKVLSFLSIPSLPIAYLALQRPGARWTWISDLFAHYLGRSYRVGMSELSWFETVLALAISAFGLSLFNRFVSQILFQRFPAKPCSNGPATLVDRVNIGFRTPYYTDTEIRAVNRRMDGCLLAVGVGLLVVAAGCAVTGHFAKLVSAWSCGLLIVCVLYFWLWVACECRNPRNAFWVLSVGLIAISSIVQIIRFLRATYVYGGTPLENFLLVLAIAVPLLLGSTSLVLLATTHQMPRRSKTIGLDVGRPIGPVREQKTNPVLFWVTGVWIAILFCSAAYWLPQNFDAATMIHNDNISLRDGWVSAQQLKKFGWNPNASERRFHLRYEYFTSP